MYERVRLRTRTHVCVLTFYKKKFSLTFFERVDNAYEVESIKCACFLFHTREQTTIAGAPIYLVCFLCHSIYLPLICDC